MTKQERLAIAHVIHSRAVMCGAPVYVTRAMADWIREIEEGTDGNVERVSVADSVSIALTEKGKVQ